ncbi:MAG: hypothetical protein ACOZCP_10075 [Pseudomonadota bacterium]
MRDILLAFLFALYMDGQPAQAPDSRTSKICTYLEYVGPSSAGIPLLSVCSAIPLKDETESVLGRGKALELRNLLLGPSEAQRFAGHAHDLLLGGYVARHRGPFAAAYRLSIVSERGTMSGEIDRAGARQAFAALTPLLPASKPSARRMLQVHLRLLEAGYSPSSK